MTLKSLSEKNGGSLWAVYDVLGNELIKGTLTEAKEYYDLNKAKIIEDTYAVGDELVNKYREKQGDLLLAKASFHVKSLDTIIVGDTTSSSIVTGVTQIGGIRGFEIDVATDSVKNISGRPLEMIGTLAIQIQHTGAQPVEFYVFSERSSDGVTWVDNNDSLRKNTILKDGVDYRTIASFTDEPWLDGEYIRFRLARSGAGNATLLPTTENIDGVVVDGHSFNWIMTERI